MSTQLRHSGGLVEAIVELGFDAVKYFEITATTAAQTITMGLPARRLNLRNTSETTAVYFNITGDAAVASANSIPGDNIKLGPSCTFSMDFDTITSISFITASSTALVEGHLGWKGTIG